MLYNSTQNAKEVVSAAQAIAQGISKDGGLFVPQEFPKYDENTFKALLKTDYKGRAKKVFSDFLSDFTEEEIKSFDYDMMIFFSPTGVKALKKNFPKFEQGKIALGAFGPATMKTVTDEGLRIDLEAPTKEFPSMTGALKDYLKRNNK